MQQYIFRSPKDYNVGDPIKCADENSKASLEYHIKNGSRVPTRFISCTERVAIALSYAFNPNTRSGDSKRNPVVLIDTSKLGDSIVYDFNDKELAETYVDKNHKSVLSLAQASREIIVEKEIPADAITKVPQLFVDILYALECEEYGISPFSSNNYDICKVLKNEMLKSLSQKDTSIMDIVEGIDFNDLERKFIAEYYGQDSIRKSFNEVCDNNFEGIPEIGHALRIDIIKKIVNGKKCKEFLMEKASDENSSYTPKEMQKMEEYFTSEKNILKNYLSHPERCTRRTAKTKDNEIYYAGVIPHDEIRETGSDEIFKQMFNIPKDRGIKFPCGLDIEEKMGNISRVIVKHNQVIYNSDRLKWEKDSISAEDTARIYGTRYTLINSKDKSDNREPNEI